MSSHRRTPRLLAPAALVAICAAAPSASAQEATDGEFSVQRLEPVAGPKNYLGVAGARMQGEWTWSAGLMFDYQRDPFVVRSCVSETDCSAPNAQNSEDVAVVQDMMTWNVLASITPIEWLQVGLRVPVAYASGEGIDASSGQPAVDGLSGAGLGDVNLEGKFRFFGEPDGLIVLAAAADVSAPLGHATSEGNYIGNSTPIAGGIRGIVDLKVDDFAAAVNLRGVFKENASFGDTTLGPEMRWGVALGYQVHDMIRPIVEGYGTTRFSTANGTNSLEIDGGLQITPLEGMLVITAAGGAGVLQGIGVPLARGIFGVSFSYDAMADEDQDGVGDNEDQCPTDAEDRDGVADSDGCPEDDYDNDRIPDEVDGCPLEPETENQFKDDDGCPDTVEDADGDGFFDGQDKCPNVVGKMRRPEFMGCPDADDDGVPDQNDKCPDQKEDTDGFDDLDGCPDPDNDLDGVPDQLDECGDQKETYNGVEDQNGCPDEGGPVATVSPTEVSLDKPVSFGMFDTVVDSDIQRGLKGMAAGLVNWASITKLEVVVTASSAAKAQTRANSVVEQLVKGGVAKERLVAVGKQGPDGVRFNVLEGPKPR